MLIQRSHYLGINARLRGLLDQQEIEHQTPRHYLASTHRLYSWMHVLIGLFLVAIAVVMFLYGWCGWFAEIEAAKNWPIEMVTRRTSANFGMQPTALRARANTGR